MLSTKLNMRKKFFFFFSSRRRHTSLQGDWSSDVCSSDLGRTHPPGTLERPAADPGDLAIATADGWLRPIEVQPENRRAMSWPEYLRGARLARGAMFAKPDTSSTPR